MINKPIIGINIRRMLEGDIPQVQAIDKLSFSLPWPKNSFRVEFENKDVSHIWVAEGLQPGGRKTLAGMIVVWLILDEVHIATIAVHPDFRRSGISRKLLGHALITLIKEGAVKAFLEVRESNAPAIALYSEFRFFLTAVRKHYYQDNHEDAFLMTLEPLVEKEIRKASLLDQYG